jgi:hypothetical protein
MIIVFMVSALAGGAPAVTADACAAAVKGELLTAAHSGVKVLKVGEGRTDARGERPVPFEIVITDRHGVPARYRGVCLNGPDQAARIRLKSAESFGRF